MLRFEQFQTNVQEWSEARGIYAHSSALAQALKAVSKVGELADATIKGNIDELRYAIGDVAVCLVNVAKMLGIENFDYSEQQDQISTEIAIGYALRYLSKIVLCITNVHSSNVDDILISSVIDNMAAVAKLNNLKLLECCESAWHEIKDRKGKMVAGGAFVKDGDE